MNEIRDRIRKIALDVVRQVNGENVDNIAAGVTFELPMLINGHDVNARFACILSDLEFQMVGVFGHDETELTGCENEPPIQQQERRLNRLFESGLRRAGFRDRELLRRNL